MCKNGCGSPASMGSPGQCQNRFGGEVTFDDTGSGLKFSRPIPSAPVVGVSGAPYGPTGLQQGVVTVSSQMLGYQDMWIGVAPDGSVKPVVFPGTYAQLYQANRPG